MVENSSAEVTQEGRLITILGPTATGKTGRAVDLARLTDGEIISADSRQVYKDMDLGTGKDLDEYGDIPYHLIDICEAGEKYNLHRFVRDFHSSFNDIKKRNKKPILCGGTGMYLETVLSGLRLPDVPENINLRNGLKDKSLEELTEILKRYKRLHNTTDIDTAKRAIRAIEIEEYYRSHPDEGMKADRGKATRLDSVIIGINIPREERRRRITKRLHKRLEEGMVKEVERLLDRGIAPENLIYYGLEYKYLTLFAIGKIPYERMVEDLEIAIYQFAKRQMTWFRGMERRGFKINWLPYDMGKDEFLGEVVRLISESGD